MSARPLVRKTLADFLTGRPTETTRYLYRNYIRQCLAVVLDKQAGEWEDSTLVGEYLGRLESYGTDRRRGAAGDLRQYVNWMLRRDPPLGYPTMSWRYTVAKQFVEWLMEDELDGWVKRDIRKDLRSRKVPRKVKSSFTREQLRGVVRWLPMDSRAFALVMKSSGGRPEEVARLSRLDVDDRTDPWTVTYRGVKEGGDRKSYVDPEAMAALAPVVESTARLFSGDQRVFAALGPNDDMVLHAVRRDWRRALGREGLEYRDRVTKRVVRKLYLLRSFFRQYGGSKEGFGREIAEVLMGHHLEATEAAYAEDRPEDEYRRLYKEGMSALALESAPASEPAA